MRGTIFFNYSPLKMLIMKLKTIDKTTSNVYKVVNGTPGITVNQNGNVNFNMAAYRHFNLNENNKVVFHQDIENPADFYCEFVNNANAFTIKCKKNSANNYLTSASFKNSVFKTVSKIPVKSVMFTFKTTPFIQGTRKLYALINPVVKQINNPINQL